MFHAALDLAPNRILPVEEGRVVEADEELAVGAVGVLGARHGADAADMRLAVELRLEVGKVASAHAGAGRVAALGHEARDHPMEHHAVIESVACQTGDPLDVAGSEVGPKLDDDIAAAGKAEGKGVGVGHRHVLGLIGWWRPSSRLHRVAPVVARA
jgi:hypothetical protein